MWLPEDAEAAMEWIEWQDSLCSGCGHPRSETMSDDADGAYEAVPITCHACAARDAEQRAAREAMQGDQYGKGAFDGLQIGVIRREATHG